MLYDLSFTEETSAKLSTVNSMPYKLYRTNYFEIVIP